MKAILDHVGIAVRDLDAALAMLRCAQAEGIHHMVATPHTCDGKWEVARDRAQAALVELRAAAQTAGIALKRGVVQAMLLQRHALIETGHAELREVVVGCAHGAIL